MKWLRGLIRQEIATVTTQITHAATTNAAQVARDIVSLQIDLHERGFRRVGDKLIPPAPSNNFNTPCWALIPTLRSLLLSSDFLNSNGELMNSLSDSELGLTFREAANESRILGSVLGVGHCSHVSHGSSPVVADAEADTSVEPALTVQEGIDGVTPAVGVAGACQCAAPASTSGEVTP